MILKLLNNTGSTVRACGVMYKAVAHAVLIYGREIWLVTGAILKILEGFHYRAARQIARMTEKLVSDGMW